MRNTLSLAGALAVALGLGACRDRPDDNQREFSMPRVDEPRAADNTGINERDRADTATTADQAAITGADVDLMARIRRSVVDDDSLSTNAHNVKIVATDGVVTLKGPVASAAERDAIVAKAAAVVGADHVVNQLEIAAP